MLPEVSTGQGGEQKKTGRIGRTRRDYRMKIVMSVDKDKVKYRG